MDKKPERNKRKKSDPRGQTIIVTSSLSLRRHYSVLISYMNKKCFPSHSHSHTRTHRHTHKHTHKPTHTNSYTRIWTHLHKQEDTVTLRYTHTCAHTHNHTHTQREIQRDTATNTHRLRQLHEGVYVCLWRPSISPYRVLSIVSTYTRILHTRVRLCFLCFS